jgi:hypothetical protein
LKLVSNVNIVFRSLKSENSQDYARKSQRNCTLVGIDGIVYVPQYRIHTR